MASEVRSKLRNKWHEFRALPAGERFQTVHEQQKDAPAWVKPVVIVAALVSFAIAVLLSVLPGPAFVFYGLAGALVALESQWVARGLDRAELRVRAWITRFHRWRDRRRHAVHAVRGR